MLVRVNYVKCLEMCPCANEIVRYKVRDYMCRVDALQWKPIDPCYRMLVGHCYCINHCGTLIIKVRHECTTRI